MPFLRLAVVILAVSTWSGHTVAQDIFAGRKVYENNCASCHGPEGRATMPGTPHFIDGMGLYASDTDLIRVVKFGKNLMPGYDRALKESEILDVISYVRTLRR
jgi:mono/diheme cytochrome c family protein